ncbi:MAG: 2-C-methyl-D-erythritol 2,4-cyclodiphosphate synthase [Sphaerochaetaceae bacterium]
MRIGTGWDIHKLVSGRKLLIGGVEIPHTLGEEGHSDGDALLHALIDALLGAAALGDIGTFFPSDDKAYKDAPSDTLLENVLEMLGDWAILNIDCTVILQEPKLGPYIKEIRSSIAGYCGLDKSQVSVKAKTTDRLLGEVGEGRAIIAQAVVLLRNLKHEFGFMEELL